MDLKRICIATTALLVFLTGSSESASSYSDVSDPGNRDRLVPLVPQQSCYYESYSKRLACVCKSMDQAASLDLKLAYFTYRSGNEIREVQLRQCRKLSIRLDFTGVDSTHYPIHFQSIEQLDIEYITFEPLYQDRQELELHFYNVQLLNFIGIYVMNTLKLKAVNVKEARFWNSTFAHIPVGGFEVSRAKLLNIKDSIFLRVSPRSVVVEKTKEVYVSFNEMSINALEAVYATDGSHLFISCNRILNRPISPECSKVTTTIPTTTTTTTTTKRVSSTSALPPIHNLGPDEALESNVMTDDERRGGMSGDLMGGIVAGIFVIVALVLLFLFGHHRHTRGKTAAAAAAADHRSIGTETMDKDEHEFNGGVTPPQAPALPPERETPLYGGPNKLVRGPRDDDANKFAAPVWMEEIQKNKIFNRQKRLLSEERLRGQADAHEQVPLTDLVVLNEALPEPPVAFREEAAMNSGDEGKKESSRTESDEEQPPVNTVGYHKHHHIQLETQI